MELKIDYRDELVLYTQKVFRAVVDSTARPGNFNVIDPFPHLADSMKGEISPYSFGIAYTFLDTEVDFHIVGKNTEKLAKYLSLETNSQATSIAKADFIFLDTNQDPEVLLEAKRGTLNYPDQGATIVLEGANLGSGADCPGVTIKLTGPGIAEQKEMFIGSLTKEHIKILQEINCEFPLGVDLIIVGETGLVVLPRSIKIELRRDN